MWKERSAPAHRFAPEDFLISRAAGLHRPASSGRWKVRAGAQLRRSWILALLFWRGIAVRLLPRRDIHDGFGVIGRPGWTGNESISRNPSGVPVLDSCTAHGAFKAADLALLYNVLAAVVNRAAFTSAMIAILTCPQYALRTVRFRVNNPAIIKLTHRAPARRNTLALSNPSRQVRGRLQRPEAPAAKSSR